MTQYSVQSCRVRDRDRDRENAERGAARLLKAPMPRLPTTRSLKFPLFVNVTKAAPGLGAALLTGSTIVCTRARGAWKKWIVVKFCNGRVYCSRSASIYRRHYPCF